LLLDQKVIILIITILKSHLGKKKGLGVRDPFVSQMVAIEWMDGLPTLPLLPVTTLKPIFIHHPSMTGRYEWLQKLW
tara:strand:+ start:292 stop:522 length:231 start_codon:yes stop_codon:yes gene_type:complete